MRDVLVVCEGQTECEFCREVVAPFLSMSGVALAGTLVGKPNRKRGGVRPWPVYRAELVRLGKERPDRHVAVLVDYYAMPTDWPGRATAPLRPIAQRGLHVEDAVRTDLAVELPGRFHPCVALHEFESLLFVEPQTVALSIAVGAGRVDYESVARELASVKTECGGSVEQINDDPATAPSKRLKAIIPGYDKVAWGVTAAKDVGLAALRAGCVWLDRWLTEMCRPTP